MDMNHPVRHDYREKIFFSDDVDYYPQSYFSVVTRDGMILCHDVIKSQAQSVHDAYADMGIVSDIIETRTIINGHDVPFGQNEPRFSESGFINRSHDAVYDVIIDTHTAAVGLTYDDAMTFVRESVSLLDIFSAIAEFVISPDFSFDDTMIVLHHLTSNDVYGSMFIRRNPASNDAPAPEPPMHDYHADIKHKRVIRNYNPTTKVTETRVDSYINPDMVPAQAWSIIDVRTGAIIFSGIKSDCVDYIVQRTAERGTSVSDYRAISYLARETYFSQEMWALDYSGHQVCIGTQSEVLDFVAGSDIDIAKCSTRRWYRPAQTKGKMS